VRKKETLVSGMYLYCTWWQIFDNT